MFKEVITEAKKTTGLQSLRHLSAVRVAILACESEDVQFMIGRFRKTVGKDGSVKLLDGQWKHLQGKVRRKLNQIDISNSVIDMVLENLWIIGYQIRKWILYHVETMGLDYSPYYCWTPNMTIDYVKTAISLTENGALDIHKRFKLACLYCLESYVRSLWEQMNPSQKRIYLVKQNSKKLDQKEILIYWIYYIQDLPMDTWTSEELHHVQLFIYAVENGYLCATKYFLEKLELKLRERLISDSFFIYFRTLKESDFIVRDQLAIACFLICQIRPDNPGIRNFSKLDLVFRYFLEWPMQRHFLAVVKRLHSCIRTELFGEMLEAIFEKYMEGFKDYDYRTLFMEFWLQMDSFSRFYVNRESRFGFEIFMRFVKKHFGFVFDEKSFAVKAKFRAVVFQRKISEDVFEKENVEFLKFLIRERITTKKFIKSFPHNRFYKFPYQEFDASYLNLPFGEILYLIDGILGIVKPHSFIN